ncbi:VOC family protein [Roseomonas rosulenta]|uniref:VOC family protein n=1 Tax=Roseomonas rosulenta TaxID=2748667 RepID=UPI0018DFF25C
MTSISTCLWFATEAEEAARFYAATIPGGRMGEVLRTPPGGPGPEGSVLLALFEIGGQPFMALNGNPGDAFTNAISLVATCADQAELDRVWDALLVGGSPIACGWLKDRHGVAWQVVPDGLMDLLAGADAAGRSRFMAAMQSMVKLDIAALRAAVAAA